MAIMELSLVALVVAGGLARRWPARREAVHLLMATTAALSLCLVRVALTLDFTLGFPRTGATEASLYPISFHPLVAAVSLIAPLQTTHWPTFANHWSQFRPAAMSMGWWEVGAYVGVLALVSAWFGATIGRRFHTKPWLAAAAVLFVMAWTNRYPLSPSYHLHFLPGYSSILVITRWRLFGCFLVLISAVAGIVALHDAGRTRFARILLLGIALDLSAHTVIAWYGAFDREPPPTMANATPPVAVTGSPVDYWPALRANRTFLNADEPVLGYVNPSLAIVPVTDAAYRGEFYSSTDVRLVSWTPNRIALDGSPGAVVRLNINPGSYWQLNGRTLFPHYRAVEVGKSFEVTVPASGHIVLTILPAGLRTLVIVQAGCALLTFALAVGFARLDTSATAARRSSEEATDQYPIQARSKCQGNVSRSNNTCRIVVGYGASCVKPRMNS
jgi:hypothetical protein